MGVLCLWGALSALSAPVFAQSLATSARQLPKGSLKLLAYYQGVQDQTVNFTLANAANCATTGGVGFACGQTGDVEAKGSGGQGLLKLVYQPWESFQYYAVGGIGDYALTVPSTTINNKLTGDTPGWTLGAGLKAVIIADTPLWYSPAVAIDASIMRSQYKFNRRFPGGGAANQNNDINQALGMTQYQVALEVSHLFKLTDTLDKKDVQEMGRTLVDPRFDLEPFAGVKWSRRQSDLHDLQDGTHAGGKYDAILPFVGLRIPVYEHEALFAEASFNDGTAYSAGLEIRFK